MTYGWNQYFLLDLNIFRMSSSLSLDLSNAGRSTPPDVEKIDRLEAKLVRKTIPVGLYRMHLCSRRNWSIQHYLYLEKDGTTTNLFIHSSHVLNTAEQLLLEYLDQPKSKTSTKCKFLFLLWIFIANVTLRQYQNRRMGSTPKSWLWVHYCSRNVVLEVNYLILI